KKVISKKFMAIFISLLVKNAYAENYYFSNNDLTTLGISSEDAQKLLSSNSFQPGVQHLAIVMNGMSVNYEGKINVGNDGKPCMTSSILADIGVDIEKLEFGENGCVLKPDSSGLIITPNVKLQQIEILAPLNLFKSDKGIYEKGGNAGIFNYNVHAFNVKNRYNKSNSYAGFFTVGINMDNWVLRNNSTLSSYNRKNKFENTETYIQKTFESQGKVLRIGDVDYYDQFYGVALRGLQWTPEPSLLGGPVTSLQGISNGDSQIEIYQLGQLVYAGQVHSGHYKIESVPVLNSQSPYEVVLTSPDGKKNRSLVSAAEANVNLSMQQKRGFSFAAGKATNIKNKYYNEPLVASTSYSWSISKDLGFGSGAFVSKNYYSIAGAAFYNLSSKNALSITEYFAEEKQPNSKDKKRGSSSSLLLTSSLGKRLTLSNSFRYRTNDYRGIEDVGSNYDSYYKWQQSNSLSANLGNFGSLGLIYSINDGSGHRQNNYSATWGKNIWSVYFSTTIQKQRVKMKNRAFEETRFYAQLSLPLSGNQRVSTSYTSGDKWRRLNTDYRKSENSGFNYGLGYSKETNEYRKQDTVFVEASKHTRFSLIGGRVNLNDDYKSLATYARGGVAIANKSITFSPYEIGDTFAVVNVGKYPDIELQTPNGKVWTDRNGNAVVSSLSSFNDNLIEVNPKTSPKNLDIMNGVKRIKPSRGTFKNLMFDTKEVNRVIIFAKDRKNKPLPYGALVTDGQNNSIVGFVDNDGMIFFNDMPKEKVNVRVGGNESCSIALDNEDFLFKPKTNMFTTLHKTCE
ncbi:fimbrial biogenesis outer membrane usher protein, partial [Escherichia coli]|nr:fimbrial biogenesis outer membrane usher protein [Escherichia coli]